MLRMMISFKAAPGYSNHSSGRAVDFSTVHQGRKLTARKAQRHQWQSSWLYTWLCANAADYGFQPLSTEEWHWDYA
jgi:LAS superfamily LD-carboxypeptidase LdcB